MDKPNTSPPAEDSAAKDSGSDFSSFLDRRSFLRAGGAAGGTLLLTSKSAIAQQANKKVRTALVGCGAQGEALLDSAALIPDPQPFEMVAICDIRPERRKFWARLKAYGHPIEETNAYEDFFEMLENEGDNIEAVIVAAPDHLHHVFTNAALEAGKAVYCEKMMSNTIENARTMVQTQEKTGGILQIGHQRRSNPRYLHVRNQLINGEIPFEADPNDPESKGGVAGLLGRVTHAYGQWNRSVTPPIAVSNPLPDATLDKYGYDGMFEMMNWRWFKKYGGGPISDLGAHQIDLFNWFLDAKPSSLMATGGVDYYTDYEHLDNVMAIYEYDTSKGKTRAYYQVLTTNSSQGFYEKWMGEYGTISLSENPSINQAYREGISPHQWETLAEQGLLKQGAGAAVYHKFWEHPKTWYGPHLPSPWLATKGVVDVRETVAAAPYELPVELEVRAHTPHVMAFFAAVQAGDPTAVNCTVQDAFATCVTVLKINEAVAKGEKVEFQAEDFIA